MTAFRRSNPHLRLTAAILVAMLAALAGGLASESADARARRAELHSALRFVVVSDDATVDTRTSSVIALAPAVDIHSARTALLASDNSSVRAERSLRRLAAHSRAALLKTTALPPPMA
ncbi:MAG: hypothetical protein RLY21_602 [Planctomycetota bacterium]|jgi:hypothetical protein